MSQEKNFNERGGFLSFLRGSYQSRLAQNPRYSLRAFARQLGVESSYLSKLFRGERNVTSKLIEKLGPQLGLNAAQISEFLHEIVVKKEIQKNATQWIVYEVDEERKELAKLLLQKMKLELERIYQDEPRGKVTYRISVSLSSIAPEPHSK